MPTCATPAMMIAMLAAIRIVFNIFRALARDDGAASAAPSTGAGDVTAAAIAAAGGVAGGIGGSCGGGAGVWAWGFGGSSLAAFLNGHDNHLRVLPSADFGAFTDVSRWAARAALRAAAMAADLPPVSR